MSTPLSATFLMLCLLGAPQSLAQVGVRRIELPAAHASEVPGVRISAGVVTVLLFDTPLKRAEVAARARFRAVGVADSLLTLVPGDSLQELAEVLLTVDFSDDAAPVSATFRLVVVPSALAERQVEVYRRPRTRDSFQQEAKDCGAEVVRLQGEVARLIAARERPEGLVGLLAAGYMDVGGVSGQDVSAGLTSSPKNTLNVSRIVTYRAARRLAVQLVFENPPGAEPWRAANVALEGSGGESPGASWVWQPAPILPGASGKVLVDVEAKTPAPQGLFKLTLWEAGGGRPIVLGNLQFP